MTHRHTRHSCGLDEECQNQLKAAMTAPGLSARAHDKVLRVARTIAELDGSDAIKPGQFNEAVNYRKLDRHLWT
jgi:magnesium chelatase family protein